MARLMVRCREVLQSAGYIDRLLADYVPGSLPAPDYAAPPAPDSLAFGLIEGWRGETCHVLLTDAQSRIAACRIKDPSLHNWLALALAVRGEGISTSRSATRVSTSPTAATICKDENMILPKIKVLRSHGKQYIPDLDAVELTEEFRGRPELTETRTPRTSNGQRQSAPPGR